MTLYVLLAIALTIWIGALWRRGFFGAATPAIERTAYWIRTGLWFVSIVLVSVPLRQQREQLGTTAYVALAFAILALFYWLGVVASRAIMKRHGKVNR